MRRVTLAASSVLALILSTTLAFASVESERGLKDLKTKVAQTKTALHKEKKLADRVKEVEKLRDFANALLEKQRGLAKPDSVDDQLALELIGLDQDLGSFLDASSTDYSTERCAGYRVALIHSYQGAGSEERTPANLPVHTQDSLTLLDLLCGGN